ncbi:transcriptional regulator [bacterium]|nr:transcriptional regulator [bacterium]
MKPTSTSLGPGIGDSQQRLLELIKRAGETTLAELDAGLELNRETLRAHLKSLGAQGLVMRSGFRRSGPGRPHVLYRLTPAGEALFPRREGELLHELASFLLEQGRKDLLEAFFETRLGRKREELRHRVEGLGQRERLAAIARILSEEGFVAEVGMDEGRPRLRLCHCPLEGLVAVSRLPCRFELALIEELLGETLIRDTFIPDGGHSCTYSVAGTPPGRTGDARRETPGGRAA